MKTLITSTGNKPSSDFDQRFGRCAWFCVFDDVTGKTLFTENIYADEAHGAGPKAAEKAYELGAEKVISGDFGPQAKEILDKMNIQMVIIEKADKSIGDILKLIKEK